MTFWTPEVTEKARKLYVDDTRSAADVARVLDCSRNTVIGKAARMGWTDKRGPEVKRLNERRAKAKIGVYTRHRPEASEPVHPPTIIVEGMNARPWLERGANECCAPIGEGWDVMSCCLPVKPGSSYCPGHHAAFYRKTAPLTEREW